MGDGKAQQGFKLPSRHDIAFAKRPDLNFAIMEFHKDHIAVEKRMRITAVKKFGHEDHGRGRIKDTMKRFLDTLPERQRLAASMSQSNKALIVQNVQNFIMPADSALGLPSG